MSRIGVVAFALLAASMGGAVAQTPLERGDYLVNAVLGCDGCHTPRGPAGFVMEKRFSGGMQVWDEPAATRSTPVSPGTLVGSARSVEVPSPS